MAPELHRVKLHGAFYMVALDDPMLARAVAEAVAVFEDGLRIYTLPGSEMWNAPTATGLRPVAEFFLDRPCAGTVPPTAGQLAEAVERRRCPPAHATD